MAIVKCCGAECGANPASLHWSSPNGTPTIETSVVAPGGSAKAWRFSPVAGTTYLQDVISGSPTGCNIRFKIRFVGSLPPGTVTILEFNAAASNRAQIQWATGGLRARWSVAGTTSAQKVVVADTWYTVDMKCEYNNAGSRTITWRVDEVDQATLSVVEASSTISQLNLGVQSSMTTTILIDDIVYATGTTEYPMGRGHIVGLGLSADGTHVIDSVGDYQYENTTNLGSTTPTDTWSHITKALTTTISQFMSVLTAAATEWLEWSLENLPSVGVIRCVEAVSTHHSASAAANKQSLWLMDGATLVPHVTDLSVPQTTITSRIAGWLTSPRTGLPWTKADVDALLVRWNSSRTTPDTTPVPDLDGFVLEVEFTPPPTAVLSGTAVGGITEADIVAGGKTIVITLTDGTLIP